MSKRLSRASEAFVATAEFNGWGDPVQPFRRMEDVELDERPVTTRISKNPDGTLRLNGVDDGSKPTQPQYGMKFYLILLALSMTNILVAFEGTVVSTALPTIVRELGGGSSYVWVSSGYFLASTVLQPLYGQLADIFVAFVVGSGISGGAPDMSIMILGRVIQGVGGGGINMLVNLIVCDLVPLRDRGKWMAVIFAAISVGTGLGPFLGGVIVQTTSWRWVFLLNLPVGVLALVLLVVFLRIKTPKSTGTWREKLAKLDLGGNFIFIVSVSMILVALAYAGTLWPWDSYNSIATLLFGVFGIVVFVFYEESNYCPHPTIPLRLFRNRTSAAAFAITFIHSMLTLLVIYFLPVYFQGVLLSTPTRSGVQMLPTVIVLFGRYKPFHIAGFLVITAGLGSFITLDRNSSMAAWVMVHLSTLLPAVQARLSDKDTAAATATWAFIRQFAIFNSRVEMLLPRISSMAVRAALDNGAAYDHGTKEYISQFQNPLRGEIISVYEDSLQLVWIFATAMAGLGFLLVNDFGMDKKD
ncbi:MFS general substrate transporter [Cucurbitaria berberidis CBS 394.84]|uniref:MFS general substrate transporter n=1 Tax=Cucurbitaria berberidis CBS 394.84 TaxID=1168544 RepID=A0A9P4L2Y8_9PLEO|nr:MFS general substrate transporter [Cucurbitaria berberidis CBS 394.84]KAF1840231.1 MFS general substrate transporter [Cucurbitaria berberidis CBS 394.84]